MHNSPKFSLYPGRKKNSAVCALYDFCCWSPAQKKKKKKPGTFPPNILKKNFFFFFFFFFSINLKQNFSTSSNFPTLLRRETSTFAGRDNISP